MAPTAPQGPRAAARHCAAAALALLMMLAAAAPAALALPMAAIDPKNPDGLWNAGTQPLGGTNFVCTPLVSELLPLLANFPSLTADDFSPWVLQSAVAAPNTAEITIFETPVLLTYLANHHYAVFNAFSYFFDNAQPVWPTPIVPGAGAPFVPRRPAAERTARNRNIAMLYATYAVHKRFLPPSYYVGLAGIFQAWGLDINDTSTDYTTPVGIGNLVGAELVRRFNASLWNPQGTYSPDGSPVTYPRPYADWTGYTPANDAYRLTKITRWQPLMETNRYGYFTSQSHITPQAGKVPLILGDNDYYATAITPPPYGQGNGVNMAKYTAQAQNVLQVSANLNDAQKMEAGYFDDKTISFGVIELVIANRFKLNQESWSVMALLEPCIGDAVQLAWREKLRHDAVRPTSAIRYLYENTDVDAWVQFKGRQTIKGREWTSYLRTMPHAEYPSGTACICAVFAEFMRAATGGNTAGISDLSFTFPQGCSRREPGFVPSSPAGTTIKYTDWDDFALKCGQSRLNAGVHFQASIDTALQYCKPLGNQCYAKAYKSVYGADKTPGPLPRGT